MKKIILSLLIFAITTATYAQKKEVKAAKEAYENGELDIAETSINDAIRSNDAKILGKVDTWLLKGQIYLKISKSEKFSLNKSLELQQSFDAYKKSLELIEIEMEGKNKEHENKAEVVSGLKEIHQLYADEASKNRTKGYFKKEIEVLEQMLNITKIKDLAISPDEVYLLLGTAYRKTANLTKAELYLDKAIKAEYGKSAPYYEKALMFKTQKLYNKMIATLKEGIEKHPDDSGLLLNELCIYQTDTKQGEAAQAYLESLNKKHPNNASVLATLGFVYEKNGLSPKAFDSCKKALSIAPEAFIPNYYMGWLHCNKAVKYIAAEDAKVKDVRTVLRKEVPKASSEFHSAKPFLEKAHQLNPYNELALIKLQMVYRKLNMWNDMIAAKKKQERL